MIKKVLLLALLALMVLSFTLSLRPVEPVKASNECSLHCSDKPTGSGRVVCPATEQAYCCCKNGPEGYCCTLPVCDYFYGACSA